uniref:Putative IS4 family transposase n=1 Tax=Diaphorobacter sp. PCA039 TaxID=266831 RepID=C0KGK8_9BURK|nr:putative IS4 family transposase [Diaphorobacter sp. PCA039]
MDPQLFLVHLRRLAAQHIHARGGLEVAQVKLDVPATRIQRREIVLADLAMIEHRGDQHLVGDFDFTDHEFVGEVSVLLGRHPLWARRRLGPVHQVIARAQRLATAKVGDTRAVLLEQHIHACGHQSGDQEIIAVQGIGQHHIAWGEAFEQAAHQSEFAAALAAVGSYRHIKRRAAGQANHHDKSRQRKTHSGRLGVGLGIQGLVLRSIGHRDPGAIDQFDRTPAPQPWRQRLLAEQAPCFARERTDHLQRQALARPAVSAGANAARAQTIGCALRCPAVDRLLARAIGLQHLTHEHGQRNRGRIEPLAMLRQQRFGCRQQFRAGQHVEELHRRGCPCPASDPASTLMQSASCITIHGGWPFERWFGSFVTTILSIPWSATSFFLQIQMLTPVTSRL